MTLDEAVAEGLLPDGPTAEARALAKHFDGWRLDRFIRARIPADDVGYIHTFTFNL